MKGKEMNKVKIEQIKKLREQTQASVMACKKALEESQGEMKKAKSLLRKKVLLKAEKKKGEEAKEGLIHAYIHSGERVGAMVKLCCQTDFVARNEAFLKLAHELCLQIASMKPKNIKELQNQEYIREPKKKIKDLLREAMTKFGENIKIEEFARFEV